MRSLAPALAIASIFSAACASTPPPAGPAEVIPYKGAKTASGDVASIDLPKDSAEAPPVTTPPNAKANADAPEPPAATPADPEDPRLVFHRIAPATVLSVTRAIQPKARACFKEGLARDPSIEGEVRIRFVITHEGQVVETKDDNSSMPDEDVTKCIASLIKSLKFPKQEAPGGAFGIYSIDLQH
jgi:hypothetical protein